MNRIAPIDPSAATGRAKELLDTTNAQLGKVPNLYRTMANSPAALDGYLKFRGALVTGVLSPRVREQIALLTAAINGCVYCVSAHTFRGGKIGMDQNELVETQRGRSDDAKENTILKLVTTMMKKSGHLSDADFQQAKAAGVTDEELGEIVAHVALNVFSNYFNHVAEPELDFPLTQIER
jgi:uncharacterized peroxidase-related enzyme